MAFTSLAHHIDLDLLREAHRRTRKSGAAGVDGQTAQGYAANLESNLQLLLERAKSGTYRAPPVRRVHIPKGDGTQTRPIGIPTFEDKILQRAVAMVLGAVYEQDFLDCSYGFRPGRSAHDALEALQRELMWMHGGWVLEVDVRKFFDTVDHEHLWEILRLRVRDGVLLRLIGKWLNAGVLEDGELSYPEAGTPQGGVISPLMANIYLHEVLDKWFERDVKPRLRGHARLVRYADDFVIAFSYEDDARRVMEVLPKRFEKYGLTLHPEKTRLVMFRRPALKPPVNGGRARSTKDDARKSLEAEVTRSATKPPAELRNGGRERPGTFDLLGFTHYWGRSRRGIWVVQRKTASDRFTRSLGKLTKWCRRYRHQPMAEQHEELSRKLEGHYEYFGVWGNFRALTRFFWEAQTIWLKWLGRRSQKAALTSERARELVVRFPLPRAHITHPYRPA